MNDREWKMYWTPSAPKWDVAPTYVKQVLFPDYHGAKYVHDSTVTANVDSALADEAVAQSEETTKQVPIKLRCHSDLDFFCIL